MKREVVRNATYISPSGRIIKGLVLADSLRRRAQRYPSNRPEGTGSGESLVKAYQELSKGDLSNEERNKYARMIEVRAERLMKQSEERYLSPRATYPQYKRDEQKNSATDFLDAKIILDRIRTEYSPKRDVSPAIAIVGILGGVFFLSANLTGNAVANLTATNSTWIGGALFLIGLIGCFSWIRLRKKGKKK